MLGARAATPTAKDVGAAINHRLPCIRSQTRLLCRVGDRENLASRAAALHAHDGHLLRGGLCIKEPPGLELNIRTPVWIDGLCCKFSVDRLNWGQRRLPARHKYRSNEFVVTGSACSEGRLGGAEFPFAEIGCSCVWAGAASLRDGAAVDGDAGASTDVVLPTLDNKVSYPIVADGRCARVHPLRAIKAASCAFRLRDG
jgi:hypothetical protein